MMDSQLLARPILPPQRAADRALHGVIAQHLKRHARVGVSWEGVPGGLLIRVGDVEYQLKLRNGPSALDDALRQLTDWGALR